MLGYAFYNKKVKFPKKILSPEGDKIYWKLLANTENQELTLARCGRSLE